MVNKVILVGFVGADPEVHSFENGTKSARLRFATTQRSYNRETKESTEYTEWHTVTLWRNLADVVDRYVNKGQQLYIEGYLRTREWTDKANVKHYTTEIVGEEIKLLGRKGEGNSATQAVANTPLPSSIKSAEIPVAPMDDDIPF